jgi:hypothetical protein
VIDTRWGGLDWATLNAGIGAGVVIVCPGFIRNANPDPAKEAGKPFILDLEDGVSRALKGIERRRAVVHFPWQLSYPMRYVVRLLPARTYDWVVGRMR